MGIFQEIINVLSVVIKKKNDLYVQCEENSTGKYSFFLKGISKSKSIFVDEKKLDLDNQESIENVNHLNQPTPKMVDRLIKEELDDHKKTNHSSNHEMYQESNMDNSQKAINLFNFIKGMNEIKKVTITDIDKHMMSLLFKDIPKNEEYIQIFSRDRSAQDDSDNNMTILSVKKPIMEPCPKPDSIIESWLESGWNNFRKSGNYIEEKQFSKVDGRIEVIKFIDDPIRKKIYDEWNGKRKIWVEEQKVLDKISTLFNTLVLQHIDLQANSETEEMIVANGILLDRENKEIRHPILTKRVRTEFDEENNIISIIDSDNPSELYISMLRGMNDLNHSQINSLNNILMEQDYHPLDTIDTPNFLKSVIHALSTDSVFSKNGILRDWNLNYRYLLYVQPMILVRKKLDGSIKAIESIIENIRETGDIPNHLLDIINGGQVDAPEEILDESIDEKLAAAGGENPDILLSKEANREQLEIAERIEKYNAVLVQGPPGTGKTHTIANLLGHFLAEGKSVLITSHTSKALNVLKEKINPGIRDLCVSVLNDSNKDMMESIDGITAHIDGSSSKYKIQMESKAQERNEIIKELAKNRRAIFNLINKEYNSISLCGEEISPADAAKFVAENQDLNYIPGKIRKNTPLPLSFDELIRLYKTNSNLSIHDEQELDADLPNIKELITPADFSDFWQKKKLVSKYIENIEKETGWTIESNLFDGSITFIMPSGRYEIADLSLENVEEFHSLFEAYRLCEPWLLSAATDGIKGGVYKNRWEKLSNEIKITVELLEKYIDISYGHSIDNSSFEYSPEGVEALEKINEKFSNGKKIGWLDRKLSKYIDSAMNEIRIDGKELSSTEDVAIVLSRYQLDNQRKKCAEFWDDLVKANEGPEFFELDGEEPERDAYRWINIYQKYLNWNQNDYLKLLDFIKKIGLDESVFEITSLDSERIQLEKQLRLVNYVLPKMMDCIKEVHKIKEINIALNEQLLILQKGNRVKSDLCKALFHETSEGNVEKYSNLFGQATELFNKYNELHDRRELIKRIEPVAHAWAKAINKREGIHGLDVVPNSIEEAWKWKQYSELLSDILKEPYDELQKKNISLSKKYRKITSEYAEISAWYHLIKRTESNITMRQALNGWKQTVQKIGKGTGKNAPQLKAEAKRLMAECQRAVPAWIMTVNKALDSLDPKQNRFDIIIIDEASQSDLSSMAILYMAKKIIVVGDDKQVSPMAVGIPVDQIKNLADEYLKGIMHISHLFDAKTSIYDIAATTFQPLMLTEHFRCVPEIINYCNNLSYNWKIKPLRDASSSKLVPAIVNYKVNGYCDNKVNIAEVDTIVALIKACIQQPEYDGKTFGVISMVGEEQANIISRKLLSELGPKIYQNRKILCGNSANFQGDERDVIFLSMVDSKSEEGPLRMRNEGADDSNKKRYNVAVSRAKDQLWVVNSLDSSNDLKSGDIRKDLIDYAKNPKAIENLHNQIVEKADSPFEIEVFSYLVKKGYHVTQQWPVGAYRLDMVVQYKNNKVAIECDGEKYHGADMIASDMERQTILERIGWKFIRLRGSEYYSDKENSMKRVIEDLNQLDIYPEESESKTQDRGDTELLERIKRCTSEMLKDNEWTEGRNETIASALNEKNQENDDIHGFLDTDSCLSKNANNQDENIKVHEESLVVSEEKVALPLIAKNQIQKKESKEISEIERSNKLEKSKKQNKEDPSYIVVGKNKSRCFK